MKEAIRLLVLAGRWVLLIQKIERMKALLAQLYKLGDADLKELVDSSTGNWWFGGLRLDFPKETLDEVAKRNEPVLLEDYYLKEADWLRAKNLVHRIFHMAPPLSPIRLAIATSAAIHIPPEKAYWTIDRDGRKLATPTGL